MTSQWRSKVFIRDTDNEQDSQAVFEKVYNIRPKVAAHS